MAAPRCSVSGRFTTQLRIKMRLFLILKMSSGDRRKELTKMPCSETTGRHRLPLTDNCYLLKTESLYYAIPRI